MKSELPNKLLAIDGGAPALTGDSPPWPRPDEAVRKAFERVWADGSWGRYHAEHTEKLIDALAELHATELVTLCSSGTVAVELALRALKVETGDEVILAGYDFPGNFRAIEAIGARPVLVDAEAGGWRIDCEQIGQAAGPRTQAVVVSHLHGELVDMPRLCELARTLGLRVVEDACQVPGALISGRRAGTWGDVGVLSFGGSKLLTAGRGGALLTADADVHQRAKVYAHRGNEAFPLSQLQAAVLLPQLDLLDKRNAQRRRAVARLVAQTAGIPGVRPQATNLANSVYYKLPWHYEASELGGRPVVDFVRALEAEGVQAGAGFRGFAGRSDRRCRKVGELPNSRRAAEATWLLHHPILLEPEERLDEVAAAIGKVARAFARKKAT